MSDNGKSLAMHRAESRAVRKALGFGEDADDVSPRDLLDAIRRRDLLKQAEALDAMSDEFEVHERARMVLHWRSQKLRRQAEEAS